MKEKKKGGLLKNTLIGFAILVFIGALLPSNDTTPSQSNTPSSNVQTSSQTPEREYIQITATELLEAYDANGVAADELYRNQYLEITGTVGSIDKDILDNAYITLTNDNDRYAIISVQCYFSKSSLQQISTLSSGDIVTVRGVCEGGTFNVVIEKCEIVG